MPSRVFLSFCCVGLFNTLVNYGVFFLMMHGLHWHYLAAGVSGFLSGAVTGFFLNRGLTFKSDVAYGRGFAAYLLLQILCLGVHCWIQFLSVRLFDMPPTGSQLPGIVVTTFLNYGLSKRFVFTSFRRT